ncbi:MAG: hypothetical protein D6767_02365 [Candidatus Hydrogenedentota bacterium]|nr:MAG: hypothetical protein D6767_02365 [Candidatus Hydrogenedentota bacterium]
MESNRLLEDLEYIAKAFFAAFLLSGSIFFVVWRNREVSQIRYDIIKLKKQKRTLYLEVERLRLQVAKFSTVDRIEKLFREKYGYLPVRISENIVRVKLPSMEMENERKNKK